MLELCPLIVDVNRLELPRPSGMESGNTVTQLSCATANANGADVGSSPLVRHRYIACQNDGIFGI